MTANITVVPEMPNASVKKAAVAKAFARQSPRHAARMSWVTASSTVKTPTRREKLPRDAYGRPVYALTSVWGDPRVGQSDAGCASQELRVGLA